MAASLRLTLLRGRGPKASATRKARGGVEDQRDGEERQRVQHADLEQQPTQQTQRGDGYRQPEHAADD